MNIQLVVVVEKRNGRFGGDIAAENTRSMLDAADRSRGVRDIALLCVVEERNRRLRLDGPVE